MIHRSSTIRILSDKAKAKMLLFDGITKATDDMRLKTRRV